MQSRDERSVERDLRRRRSDSNAPVRLQPNALLAGERVRTLRLGRGWTQEQLAQATGVSRSAVAQWETGRAGFGAKVDLIAGALDVPVKQLRPGHPVGPVKRLGDPTVTTDEAMLLRHFRELDHDDRDCVVRVASRLAKLVSLISRRR